MTDGNSLPRPRSWKWLVCGLLLLATMLNYMDRMTLNQLGPRIIDELKLTKVQYGRIESAFALAFACGALVMGWLADRINVRWLYPAAVLAWSVAGFATGFATGFLGLVLCRFLLGLAEAGNWPCALRTTQRILLPEQRTMGNSLLQSGAALGAVLTPLIILAMLELTGSWRYPFLAIGTLGGIWVVLWLAAVRGPDLALPPRAGPPGQAVPFDRPSAVQVRRFIVLVLLVVSINLSWHFFRAWLPLFLRLEACYTERQTQLILTAYYVSTDLGTLSAGALTLLLIRFGEPLHSTRLLVFLGYALLVALSVTASAQPPGPLLLVLLMLVGFGALGVFPVYYSLSQELTTRHQGKVTGALGFCCWMAMALLHEVVGHHVEATQSYRAGIALAGLAPLAGFLVLLLLWGKSDARRDPA